MPVTLVVAPAGFGKTTLLGQAMQENRLAPQFGAVAQAAAATENR